MNERKLIIGAGLAPGGEGWTYSEEPMPDVSLAEALAPVAWLLNPGVWHEERRGPRP